jgi:hypothetical protein
MRLPKHLKADRITGCLYKAHSRVSHSTCAIVAASAPADPGYVEQHDSGVLLTEELRWHSRLHAAQLGLFALSACMQWSSAHVWGSRRGQDCSGRRAGDVAGAPHRRRLAEVAILGRV